jgi:hypothetical protein
MRKTLAMLLALGGAAAFALPAAAQGDAARNAAALDRSLGANADPPRPRAVTAPSITWPHNLPPVWISGQPYRQQPLLTAVPPGGTIGGRRRSTPGGP